MLSSDLQLEYAMVCDIISVQAFRLEHSSQCIITLGDKQVAAFMNILSCG